MILNAQEKEREANEKTALANQETLLSMEKSLVNSQENILGKINLLKKLVEQIRTEYEVLNELFKAKINELKEMKKKLER